MNLEKWAKPVLRIGLSLVFLYFGFQQVTSPDIWAGYVPNFALFLGSAEKIALMNGIFELIFGLLLIIGLFTRFVALILSLHLFVIASSLGFNDLGMRDFGLALATLAVFLNGEDKYCLDSHLRKS